MRGWRLQFFITENRFHFTTDNFNLIENVCQYRVDLSIRAKTSFFGIAMDFTQRPDGQMSLLDPFEQDIYNL